ncbi:hypothetical protein BIW11_02613 [Tropilaelaps mercedesae]|uniref:Uncharacterized protein n=1 Tax=Tropilaelaps mercedesae TaxID=418985 RepID=A0A1V9Y057_9ACAR|nr:hypothetical protein BIW11_02613 [Tropilaelaps mercedesae]
MRFLLKWRLTAFDLSLVACDPALTHESPLRSRESVVAAVQQLQQSYPIAKL